MYLHILSFDIPFPASYGGVIDVYHRLKALKKAGVKVLLHCFYHNRSPQPELTDLCAEVYYYPRKTYVKAFPFLTPYMVKSRQSDLLTQRLAEREADIWIEGIQGCYDLTNWKKIFPNRKIYVRMHNVESDYYQKLSNSESDILKKIYFKWEAFLLKRFERVLQVADGIFPISPADTAYFASKYQNVQYLAAFHGFENVDILEGKGNFALYHGNLSVSENHQAALYLIYEVFANLDYPLVIAGAGLRPELQEAVSYFENIQLVNHPSNAQLHELLQTAHLHVLPTFQATGIKLKLLYALFKGRFVLANSLMVAQTHLEEACHICATSQDFCQKIEELKDMDFTKKEIVMREDILEKANFSEDKNVQNLLKILRNES